MVVTEVITDFRPPLIEYQLHRNPAIPNHFPRFLGNDRSKTKTIFGIAILAPINPPFDPIIVRFGVESHIDGAGINFLQRIKIRIFHLP